MANEKEEGYVSGGVNQNLQLNDLEEKQSIMKDRLLLIGKNLVDVKEDTSERILEMKKDIEIMKHEIERIRSFLDSMSSQMGKFAKKEDLEILSRQAKMFQPFAR